MTNFLIYINDRLADTNPGTTFATTIFGYDITNPTTYRSNYTSNIKLPDTTVNREIFGTPDINSQSSKPYQSFSARVLSNGVEIITNGKAVLKSYDGGGYNISIYSGIIGFFDLIKGKKVYDAKGLLMPDILNGLFFDPEIYDGTTLNLNFMPQMPVSFYKDLVEGLFTLHGYEFEGDVFSDEKYLAMMFTVGNISWPKIGGGTINTIHRGIGVYQNDFSVSMINDSAQVFNFSHASGGIDTDTNIVFSTILKDDIYNSCRVNDQVPWQFNYPYSGRAYGCRWKITASVTLNSYSNAATLISVFFDIIYNNGTLIETLDLGGPFGGGFTSGQTKLFEIDALFSTSPSPFRNGDNIRCRIRTQGNGSSTYTAQVTVNFCNLYNDNIQFPLSGSGASITTPYPAYASGTIAGLGQDSIIKDFIVRFGLVVKEKNETLYFKGLQDILSEKSFVDWTDKRVDQKDEIEYSLTKFYRTSWYKYTTADDFTGEFLNAGSLTIDNNNLNDDGDVFVSPFSTCANVTAGTATEIPGGYYYLAKMSTAELKSRLVLARDKRTNEPNLPGQAEKILYSEDPEADITTLSFQSFLDDNYAAISQSLQRFKIVTRWYILNEIDIHTLDTFKLVFDTDSYFIVSKINNYIPGKSVEVELFKVL